MPNCFPKELYQFIVFYSPVSNIWVWWFHHLFFGSKYFQFPSFTVSMGEKTLNILICISLITTEAEHFFPYVPTEPFDQRSWHVTDLSDSYFPYSYSGSNPQKEKAETIIRKSLRGPSWLLNNFIWSVQIVGWRSSFPQYSLPQDLPPTNSSVTGWATSERGRKWGTFPLPLGFVNRTCKELIKEQARSACFGNLGLEHLV